MSFILCKKFYLVTSLVVNFIVSHKCRYTLKRVWEAEFVINDKNLLTRVLSLSVSVYDCIHSK